MLTLTPAKSHLIKTKSCADFIPHWSDLNAPSPSKMERIYVALGLTCRQQSILKIHFFFVQLHIQIRMCLKGRGLCPLLAEAVWREESGRRKRKRKREVTREERRKKKERKKLWAREIETSDRAGTLLLCSLFASKRMRGSTARVHY